MSLIRFHLPWAMLPLFLGLNLGCANITPAPMTYQDCAASRVCTVRGIATAKFGEHGPTVELDLGHGRCVNVSLPTPRWEALRRAGPTEMTIVGSVHREPPLVNGQDVVLEIDNRRIGYGLCGNFFLFVRAVRDQGDL